MIQCIDIILHLNIVQNIVGLIFVVGNLYNTIYIYTYIYIYPKYIHWKMDMAYVYFSMHIYNAHFYKTKEHTHTHACFCTKNVDLLNWPDFYGTSKPILPLMKLWLFLIHNELYSCVSLCVTERLCVMKINGAEHMVLFEQK